MRVWPECVPCVLRMSLETIRAVVTDEDEVARLFDKVLACQDLSVVRATEAGGLRPAERVGEVWRELVALTGDDDLLAEAKARQNSLALSLLPAAREFVLSSPDPFLAAAKLAAAGNVFDIMIGLDAGGPSSELLERMSSRWVDEAQVEVFRERVAAARRIVYFTDNCGEIVFDRLLLEVVSGHGAFGGGDDSTVDHARAFGAAAPGRPEITAVVRSLPVINDATLAEARQVGLHEVAHVIENGISFAVPATVLGEISAEVAALVRDADLVVSKGGANFELLEEEEALRGKVTFLLLGKCGPLCDTLHVPRDGLVVHNA